MTKAECVFPEYQSVIRRSLAEGWAHTLLEAHSIPIEEQTAVDIVMAYRNTLPKLRLLFRHRIFRGRAGHRLSKGYRISLPSIPGGRSKKLRAGLVLHEMAHIWDHVERKKMGHGPEFCAKLRWAVESPAWRKQMPTSSLKKIYDNHQGPYSLQIVREMDKKGKPAQGIGHIDGPFSAEEAHEEARLLVKDPKDTVVEVFVFSIKEGQFIGCFYKRGEAIRPWHEEVEAYERLELAQQRGEAALVPGREEPLRSVDDPVLPGVPADAIPPPAGVRDVPKKEKPAGGTKLPGDRFPAVRGRALTIGDTEGWPKSAPAQKVRGWFAGRTGTSAELVQALGPELKEMGVEFPASLVSRLKQKGLLKEVAA